MTGIPDIDHSQRPAERTDDDDLAIRDALAASQQQVKELQAWKDSAIAVEQEWDCQEVARELDLPLGCSIRRELMLAIRSLKGRAEAAEANREKERKAWDAEAEAIRARNREYTASLMRAEKRIAELVLLVETAEFLVSRLKSAAYATSDREACDKFLRTVNAIITPEGK